MASASGFGNPWAWRATALALGFVWAAAAAGEPPAIARPGLAAAGLSAADAKGVVFFLASSLPGGAVAVGTAHTLEVDALLRAGRVDFALPGSFERVGSSTRYASAPGLPLDSPGGSLAGDFVVFRLDQPLQGARALEAEPDALSSLGAGARLRILGPPDAGTPGEGVDAYGRVIAASEDKIVIELDVQRSLRGWGGAPVLLASSDRVVGLVEAAAPGSRGLQLLAAPIEGVLGALSAPLLDGDGQGFAAYHAQSSAAQDSAPPPDETHREPAPLEDLPAPTLELVIEYPPDGASVGTTTCGTFVAGHAAATRGVTRRYDVILVIDTSRSAADPSGADVNGNGEIGTPRLGALGAMFGSTLSDPGDSILAAEIAGARQILRGLDARSTRVGLVAFAGEPAVGSLAARRKPAYTVEPLTRDYPRIERGLDELLATAPEGSTHMAAGLDQATIELLGLRRAYSKADPDSEKIVFFFTDGQPTLPYPDSEAENVRAVLRAASRAQSQAIRVHSFAIGREALEGPIAVVEMASRTGGVFTPVREPGDLVDVVEEVRFSDLAEVRLENARTKQRAAPFRLTPDGTWGGFVETTTGSNRLLVSARSEAGSRASRRLTVLRPEAPTPEPPLPRELVGLRNRLLEDCLIVARQRRLDREEQRHDEIRRKLRLEIERERAEARKRAEAQRKTLELELEDEGGR